MKLKSLLYSEKIEHILNKNRYLIYIVSSIIFLILIIYNINDKKELEKNRQIGELSKILSSFETKDENIDLLVTIVSLENYIKEKYIKISSLKMLDKGFSLELEGEYNSTIGMVDFIEKRSSLLKVEKFSVNYNEKRKITNVSMDVKILKNKKVYKEKESLALVNVFEKNEIKKKKEEEKTKKEILLRLHAIVEDMVFINDSWFKVGDNITDKKIVYIGKDFIKLKSNNIETKLWMYNSGTIR